MGGPYSGACRAATGAAGIWADSPIASTSVGTSRGTSKWRIRFLDKVLGEYVREKQALSLENAIYRMSGLPAKTIGMGDRGLLKPGMVADVVVFDPGTVIDRATYDDQTQISEGIVHALVKNPRTPVGMAARLLPRLSVRDMEQLAKDRNVANAVRSTAKRLCRMKRS